MFEQSMRQTECRSARSLVTACELITTVGLTSYTRQIDTTAELHKAGHAIG